MYALGVGNLVQGMSLSGCHFNNVFLLLEQLMPGTGSDTYKGPLLLSWPEYRLMMLLAAWEAVIHEAVGVMSVLQAAGWYTSGVPSKAL